MVRLLLAGGLTLAAILLVLAVFVFDDNARVTGILLNLGAEIVGIALTVAIVDWLIERNELRDESQRLAWRMLHDVDHAVWVWQGGRREFHLDELAALLEMVEDTDPFPEFTKELLVNLGSTASDDLRLHRRLLRFDRCLQQAVTVLAGLAQLRDLDTLMPASFIVQSLRETIDVLASVVEHTIHRGAFGVARTFRDPAEEAQRRRCLGSQHESLMRAARSFGQAESPRAGEPSR